jgi:hypothetical protein
VVTRPLSLTLPLTLILSQLLTALRLLTLPLLLTLLPLTAPLLRSNQYELELRENAAGCESGGFFGSLDSSLIHFRHLGF